MEQRHYNTVLGGYTKWEHPKGIITLVDGASVYKILHHVLGMDGNQHRVFWHENTLEDAVAYLDRQ